jgi:arylsulfatase
MSSTSRPRSSKRWASPNLIEAARYNVLPLDDRLAETSDPHIAGRPEIVTGTSQLLFPGMRALNEDCVLNMKNRSHSITAELELPEGRASGVIFTQGGVTGGWSLYFKDGIPKYHYNWASLEHYEVVGDAPVSAGAHQLRLEFEYDGGGLGQAGTANLYVDGKPDGSARIEHTSPFTFSLDETSDVGFDRARQCATIIRPVAPTRSTAASSSSASTSPTTATTI